MQLVVQHFRQNQNRGRLNETLRLISRICPKTAGHQVPNQALRSADEPF